MRCSRRVRDDGGMVTAELAACLPVLILLLAVALSAVSVASLRVRAQDAAREAARAAARGDSAAATALAREAAPGAQVRILQSATEVTVIASVHVHLLVGFLPSVTVTERAVAAREPP
jgi:Flp pilus assembly protein TadG